MSDNRRRFALVENGEEAKDINGNRHSRAVVRELEAEAFANFHTDEGLKIEVEGTLEIDLENPLSISNLAESIMDIDLEANVLETVVAALDEQLVTDYCGEKHAQGNGEKRFQRGGTTTRSVVTTAGEHGFTLNYVEDTAASGDTNTYFRPIEDIIGFNGTKNYQQDVLAKSVLLHYDHRLSYRKVSELFGQLYDYRISPTSVERAGKYLYPPARNEYDQIHKRIREAEVLHIDETQFPVDGENYWLWGFTTGEETLYTLRESRGSVVLEDILGEIFNGIIVCDGYSAYPAFHSRLQRCWAHLLRGLHDLSEEDEEAKSIYEDLQDLRDGLEDFDDTDPTPVQRIIVQREARNVLENLLADGADSKEALDVLDTLQRGLGDWLRFVVYPNVESTNNPAEAVLRESVIMRKMMDQLQNERGIRFYETYASLIQTWKQQGENPFTKLRQLARQVEDLRLNVKDAH